MVVATLTIFQVWFGVGSSLEDLVQVDVVPLAVNILWPQNHFQGD